MKFLCNCEPPATATVSCPARSGTADVDLVVCFHSKETKEKKRCTWLGMSLMDSMQTTQTNSENSKHSVKMHGCIQVIQQTVVPPLLWPTDPCTQSKPSPSLSARSVWHLLPYLPPPIITLSTSLLVLPNQLLGSKPAPLLRARFTFGLCSLLARLYQAEVISLSS